MKSKGKHLHGHHRGQQRHGRRQHSRNLRQYRAGDTVEVEGIQGSGAFRRRLIEMGFIPGARVRVKKYAPLKDPVEFVIKGYHVSLRREEAEKVLVRSLHETASDEDE